MPQLSWLSDVQVPKQIGVAPRVCPPKAPTPAFPDRRGSKLKSSLLLPMEALEPSGLVVRALVHVCAW